MRARKFRALMLGWEYPPRFAGGLGKACRGISSAMARRGTQIFFVLPTFPDRVSEPELDVIGAREALIEAGWNPRVLDDTSAIRELQARASAMSGRERIEVSYIHAEARLYPYGAAPEGPTPEIVRRFLNEEISREGEPRGTVSELRLSGRKRSMRAPGAVSASAGIESARGGRSNQEIYGRNLWAEIEKFTFSVRQMAETHEVDLVHAHDWMTFPAAFEYQRMTGAPVFLHVHATEYDRSGEAMHSEVYRIEREGFRRATHIFAVSKYTAGIIERLYGVSRKKITVVYNAPDDEAKHMIGSVEAPRKPQVVFLGRLTFQKGPDHFLKAAALVAEADAEAKFVFCGTGDMLKQLRSMAAKLGIEERVHFAGFVEPPEAERILQESKVLVMPSVSEPFGLVALEAIHCGIPVIMSKQSGVREVLHRSLQIDFWDHERLADQILAALRLGALNRQLVAEGMDQVRQLSWERSAKKIIETYRKHLGSKLYMAVEGAHGR